MKVLVFAILLVFMSPAYSLSIDPANSVLDVPWDSSEDEAEKILGKSNGFFQATKYKKYVFYGKSIALVFEREKLKGFIYSEYLLIPLLNEAVSINPQFSSPQIEMNGVKLNGMGFSELASKLPYKLGSPAYQVQVATDETQIQINFSSISMQGVKEDFKFSGLEIHYEL